MNKTVTPYRTADLYFAAYLCSLDVPLVASEADGDGQSRKMVFVFNLTAEDLPRLKSSYFGGMGTVKVRKFVDNLRSLKSLLHV